MVQTYNPKDVRVTIAGLIANGFSDGTSVTVEKSESNLYNEHVGAQGEVSRTSTTNRTALLKISLKQTSPFNAALQKIALTLNVAKFPVSITNSSDLKYLGGAAECWIKTVPNKELGGEEQMREWGIFMADFTEKEG